MKTLILFFVALAAFAQPADPALEMVAFPPLVSVSNTSTCTMNASGERTGSVIYAPWTGNISHVIFSTRGATTPETLRVGIYTVDSSGNPTTTNFGGSTPGTQTSPTAPTAYRVALGTVAAVTAGDIIAPMVDFDSAIGNMDINSYSGAAFSTPGKLGASMPRGVCYTGSWALRTHPAILIEYDDGRISSGAHYTHINTTSASYGNFNSGTASTPHRGNKITMAYSMLATDICAQTGTWGAGASAIFRITDTSLNTLASTQVISTGIPQADTVSCFTLTASLPLSKGVSYYVFAIPQNTNNINLNGTTEITGWNSYDTIADLVASIQGDQATSFTEASASLYTLVVQGVRLPTAGGFTVTQ